MAEIAGLTIGASALVPDILSAGYEFLVKPVQDFRNAPQIIRDFETFGLNLHQGKLKLNVELAQWARSQPGVEQPIKDALEDYIARLRLELLKARDAILGLRKDSGEPKKRFALDLNTKASKALESLKRWQEDFERTLSLLDMRSRLTPADSLLTRDKFRLFANTPLEPVPGAPMLFVGKGEYKDISPAEVVVLLERKPQLPNLQANDLKATVQIIASNLRHSSPSSGILRCLGYQEDMGLRLIFQVPAQLHNPRSLSSMIRSSAEGVSQPPPISQRRALCRRLSEAVFAIHTAGMVHKSIRPDSVLVFDEVRQRSGGNGPTNDEDDQDENELRPVKYKPHLINWELLRKLDDVSSRRGEDDWRSNLYRHPRRQGLQPEARYNLGHDVYSLGILLLEIILWEPFILRADNADTLSSRYRDAAVARLGEPGPSQPVDEVRRLTAPLLVQETMVDIARLEIPGRVGNAVERFVVGCLTCLEGGMGNKDDWIKRPNAAALWFDNRLTRTFVVED